MRWLVLVVALSMPAAAAAVPSYNISLGQFGYGSPVPFALSANFTSGEDVAQQVAYSARGHVGALASVDSHWSTLGTGGAATNAGAQATDDDFIITGPPGPTTVTGTIYFPLQGTFQLSGGSPGSTGINLFMSVSANGNQAVGSYNETALSTTSDGPLAGLTGPSVDLVIPVAGTFPVGSSFGIFMSLTTGASTYGNVMVAPAVALMDMRGGSGGTLIGLSIGDATGNVMNLPAGYTVSSSSWGVSGGQFAIVGVGPEVAPREPGLDVRGGNPAHGGDVRLSWSLPVAGAARLEVFDAAGRRVRSLVGGVQDAGVHDATWTGTDDSGRRAGSGVYFVRLVTGEGTLTRRVVLLR